MHIYFRACEKQQTISNVTRFQNISKTEIIMGIFKSDDPPPPKPNQPDTSDSTLKADKSAKDPRLRKT